MSNENKEPQQQHPAPDPRHVEAQIYQRIEAARKQIAVAVNKTMMDTGLPTAIVLELLRGIVAETSLMLERAGKAALRAEIEEAVKEAAKKQGDKDK